MKYITLSFLMLLGAQAASAQTTNYLCTMTKQDSHGWIAPEYAFQIDPTASAALAASSHHTWEEAKFKNRGAKGYRIVWNMDQTMAAGGNVRVRYQANLDPTDNTIKVRMAFLQGNFLNKPYGVGACAAQ